MMSPVPENVRTRDGRITDQAQPEYINHTSSSDSDGVEFMLNHGPDTYGYTMLPQDPDGPLFDTQLQGYTMLPQDPDGPLFDTQLQDDDDDDENVDENSGECTLDILLTEHLDRDDLVNSGAASQIDNSNTQLSDSVWNNVEAQSTIPMDEENKDAIMKAMRGFNIPLANQPDWATGIMEESWKEQLLSQIQQKNDTSLHMTKQEVEELRPSDSITNQNDQNEIQTHNPDTAD